MKIRASKPDTPCIDWSNRILILSLLGIGLLTLFPFQYNFSPRRQVQPSILLLKMSHQPASSADFFLNVLLFVPFGFGVFLQTRKRSYGRWTSLMLAVAAGAIVSYLVEILQLFVPTRDSSWDDVVSNSVGSAAGFVLFELCGNFILGQASKVEVALQGWLSPLRACLLLVLYFGFWFGVSIFMQKQTSLSNWDPQCSLTVGNDASGHSPWKGRVSRLEIWNRVLAERQIGQMTHDDPASDMDAHLLASYEFTASSPYEDQRKFLPAMAWTASSPAFLSDPEPRLDGRFGLSTKIPVAELTRAIQETNQFTIRIVCAPAEVRHAGGRIVSISHSNRIVNFQLGQSETKLVLSIRNPLSERHSLLTWSVNGVFEDERTRDIVASYDGSDAFLYVDGIKVPQKFRLGPGARFARQFVTLHTEDLEAYVVLYEILIFLPAGLLIGVAARNLSGRNASVGWMLAILLILPAVLLEILLIWVSGRRIWGGNIAFSLLLSIAGALLINSDLRPTQSKPAVSS